MNKKLFALLIALVMVFTLAIPASAVTTELITNGNFETAVPGTDFFSDYTLVTALGNPPGGGTLWGEGAYALGLDPYDYHSLWNYGPHGDHTTGSGKMMIINGSTVAGKTVWGTANPVTILANRTYSFSFWAANIYTTAPATLDLYINNDKIDTFEAPADPGVWAKYDYHWSSTDDTTAEIKLVSPTLAATGNDYCFDDFSLTEYFVPVEVDIKPTSDPNGINNDGHGVIPVAILGSETLDVMTIDPATVTLDGMSVRFKGKSMTAQASYKDYNLDGYLDLIVQIEDIDGTFSEGQTIGTVTGQFYGGGSFLGTDTLKLAPAN